MPPTNDDLIRQMREPGLIYATAYGATCQIVHRMHLGELTPDQAWTRIIELRGVVDSHLQDLAAEALRVEQSHLVYREGGKHSRLDDHFEVVTDESGNGDYQNGAGGHVIEP